LLRDSVAGLAKRLEQDIYNWVKSREQRLSEVVKEFTGSTGTMEYRLRETIVRLAGAQGLPEYEAFKESLPEELREWMEEASVNHVAHLYEKRGCHVLEKNIGVAKPYDLLVECPGCKVDL
jgi:hypothetical protein